MIENLLELKEQTVESILDLIQQRYMKNEIYTGVGDSILVSMNPYQNLPIYGGNVIKKYQQKQKDSPHVYKIAQVSLEKMFRQRKYSSILISGESGAGKTEACKKILSYVAGSASSKLSMGSNKSIEDQILDTNPLLESLGNAKTVRNDNSSRYGKFIRIIFDSQNTICAGVIDNYLLEKVRVTQLSPQDRNYHIFYQMLRCGDQNFLDKYKLKGVKDYAYLKNGDTAFDNDDQNCYHETISCYKELGFDQKTIDASFSIFAGILHLGNIGFSQKMFEGNEGSVLDENTAESQQAACEFLGINLKELEKLCCVKKIKTPNALIDKYQSQSEAIYNRNSFATMIYSKYFDWLIAHINSTLDKNEFAKSSKLQMGILDIFGFEIFEVNGFEQICINYTNEKLQQHFNKQVITEELAEYKHEGVQMIEIDFKDNKDIIAVFERTPGIFSLIDDQCKFKQNQVKDADQLVANNFVGKIKSSKFKISQNEQKKFTVTHFAGDVKYEVKNFIDKNTDINNDEFVIQLSKATNKIVYEIFKSQAKVLQDKKKKGITILVQLRCQLDELMETVVKSNTFYVKCIKPNQQKKQCYAVREECKRQLLCSGMLETVKIRDAGYPVRTTFEEFFNKYYHLDYEFKEYQPLDQCIREFLQKIQQQPALKDVLNPQNKRFVLGTNKIFMKEDMEEALQICLDKKLEATKNFIQKFSKKFKLLKIKSYFNLYIKMEKERKKEEIDAGLLKIKKERQITEVEEAETDARKKRQNQIEICKFLCQNEHENSNLITKVQKIIEDSNSNDCTKDILIDELISNQTIKIISTFKEKIISKDDQLENLQQENGRLKAESEQLQEQQESPPNSGVTINHELQQQVIELKSSNGTLERRKNIDKESMKLLEDQIQQLKQINNLNDAEIERKNEELDKKDQKINKKHQLLNDYFQETENLDQAFYKKEKEIEQNSNQLEEKIPEQMIKLKGIINTLRSEKYTEFFCEDITGNNIKENEIPQNKEFNEQSSFDVKMDKYIKSKMKENQECNIF